MNRVAFLVDGFNVYHSVRAALQDAGGVDPLQLELGSDLRRASALCYGL